MSLASVLLLKALVSR